MKFEFGKSFINIKMKNGPKIEPWGTPKITDFKDDLAFPP